MVGFILARGNPKNLQKRVLHPSFYQLGPRAGISIPFNQSTFGTVDPDDAVLADPTDIEGGDFHRGRRRTPPDVMGVGSTYISSGEDDGDVPANATPDATETDVQPNDDLIHVNLDGSHELTGGALTMDADAFAP